MATARLLTAEDVARLPDDGHRYDLIRGELIRMAPAGGEHGEVDFTLAGLLFDYLRRNPIGRGYGAETGFLLARDPDVMMGPDLAFVRSERLPARGERRRFLQLAPDFVVEVVSPSDRARTVADKVRVWLEAGVRLLWLVHPRRRTVTVYAPGQPPRVLREGDELDGGAVLPGFRVPVATIFA